MVVSQTLRDKIITNVRSSQEWLTRTGAYTIIFFPKAMILGGGVAIGYAWSGGDFMKALGGVGLAGLGAMMDYSILRRVVQENSHDGNVVYRRDDVNLSTLDNRID